jgi:L-ribulose-5-phosphate 4-epimerase
METKDMKQIVLEISKQSFEEKLFAGTSGNLSVYDPDSKLMAITPSGVDYPTMQIDDIIVMTLEGEIVEAKGKPSSEWRMHATIYQNRPDVNAVIHTHSPYATGFAIVNKSIPAVLIEMVPFIGGDIPIAEFAYPGTAELGQAALSVLHNRCSCLLANHGVLAIGNNLKRTHLCATYTEDAAKICAYGQAVGEIKIIPRDVQNAIRRKYGIQEE